MTWVKICGITNLEDALTAVEAGADALGFVFYEKSSRNVAPQIVREIVREIPPDVEKVGVFVGCVPENLLELIGVGLNVAQIQAAPTADSKNMNKAYGLGCFPPDFKMYYCMPARLLIDSEASVNSLVSGMAKAAAFGRSSGQTDRVRDLLFGTIFLDSGDIHQPGGTGITFDWRRAAPVVERLKQSARVVVAGGLNPTNVTEAIHTLNPWGVDVSSGVEAKPGKKDPEKVRAFVAAVRRTERPA